MKHQLFIVGLALSVASCVGGSNGGGSLSSGSIGLTLSGTAATGAPVSNGVVIIKDKDGDSPAGETLTGADGTYSVDVQNLDAPFLIHVTSPSGEKLISVANQSDVDSGKKVNVTPLTHAVVANVFNVKDADELLENFASEVISDGYNEDLLDDKKEELLLNLSAAITALGLDPNDPELDIMNGNFTAGSGADMDKVLDAINVNISTASADINITFKGSDDPIVVTNSTGTTKDDAVVAAGSANINVQLTNLDEIKDFYQTAASEYSEIVPCIGEPVKDDTSHACHVDKLYDKMAPFMHTLYKYDGAGKTEDTWSFFCESTSGNDATSAETCDEIYASLVSFKDLTIINFKKDDAGNHEAFVSYNIYMDGKFHGFETETIKKEDGQWKFYGNRRQHQIWINSESIVKRRHLKSTNQWQASYLANIVMHAGDRHSTDLSVATDMVLTALNSDGSPDVNLNLKLSQANNNAVLMDGGLKIDVFPQMDYVQLSISTKKYRNSEGEFCDTEAAGCYYNWESNKIDFSKDVLDLMDNKQPFKLSYRIGDETFEDSFFIQKPLVMNSTTESKFAPFFENEDTICSTLRASYNVSAPTGMELDWASIWVGWNSGMDWFGANANESLDDSATLVLEMQDSDIELPVGQELGWSNFYVSADDELDRRFVKQISCEP